MAKTSKQTLRAVSEIRARARLAARMSVRGEFYEIPETITLTRDQALPIAGVIDHAIEVLRSGHKMCATDLRTLERASYLVVGMSIPSWLRDEDEIGE